MIEEFDSHIRRLVPSIGEVKKQEDQSNSPLIKLEWCGMQCSGKYGLLTKVDNHSTAKLGISVDKGKLL